MREPDEPNRPVVVKVGGSLFDLPDLGRYLRRWLEQMNDPHVVLVPGGGPTADAVRILDRQQRLGDEASHWLALRALALNAWFLGALLQGRGVVVTDEKACIDAWKRSWVPIVDLHAFALCDETSRHRLPHTWQVTSDSLAARLALQWKARRLVLLKSVSLPGEMTWEEAGRRHLVDVYFAQVLESGAAQSAIECAVSAINFREWASTFPPRTSLM